jgi:hypothetical protein
MHCGKGGEWRKEGEGGGGGGGGGGMIDSFGLIMTSANDTI